MKLLCIHSLLAAASASTPSGTFHTIRFRSSCLPSICQLLIHLFLCLSILPSHHHSSVRPLTPGQPQLVKTQSIAGPSCVASPSRSVTGVPRSRQIAGRFMYIDTEVSHRSIWSLLNELANKHHVRFLCCSSPSILKRKKSLVFLAQRTIGMSKVQAEGQRTLTGHG